MVEYIQSTEGISPESISNGFFEGWPNPPSVETHVKLLKQSDFVVLAIDKTVAKVVGFITAISDGVLCAYVPLLEVLPLYRGQGIGHELVRRMLERLNGLYMIDLTCDPRLQGFYEQHSMNSAMAMIKRNYNRQSGV